MRKWLKKLHPEGIPWPGVIFYNALSGTQVMQKNYEILAADIVQRKNTGALLDVGTGPGRLLLEIYRRSPDLRLTGMDVSRSMVEQARKNMAESRLSEKIRIVEGNVSDMPFPDESFDIVVSTGAMHHWKDTVSGINEIHRVLKPGGEALIYDLVKKIPQSVMKEASREFGRLKMFLLWFHSFEEPFLSINEMRAAPKASKFLTGHVQFVGISCRLVLKKT